MIAPSPAAARPREVVADQPGRPVFRAYDELPLAPGQVRIATEYGSIKHGTDLQMFQGIDPLHGQRWDDELRVFQPVEPGSIEPFRLGNMFFGRIAEIGGAVTGFAVGDQVAGYGPLRTTHTITPSDRWDGWLRKLPAQMPWQNAVCYDPAQFAFGGVRDGGIRLGDAVAVFGLGAIGLLAVQFARLAGASKIIAVDPICLRRAAALALGADHALDPASGDAGLEIKHLTGRQGVDVAIETSGSYPALHQAIRGCAYGGAVSVVGWYKECKGGLTLGREAHFNQINLIVSRACNAPNRDHPRWTVDRLNTSCWDLLSRGRVDCRPLLTPIVPFDDTLAAVTDLIQHPDRSIKLGIRF